MENRFQFEEVEGLRVGLYPYRVNGACTLYRIGDFLVDTGPPNQWRRVRKFISEKDVSTLVLTHHHEDHAGNARRIHDVTSAKVLSHESGLDYYRNGFEIQLYRRLTWGTPYWGLEPQSITGDLNLQSGLLLRPIHTPGHSDDMTCFHEPNRGWLFTGDAYVSAQPKFLRCAENPILEIESLKALSKLDFQTVFCAHRGILRDGKRDIQRKLDYLQGMRQRVGDLAEKGLSQKEVTRRILGRESLLSYFSLFDFSKRNFIRAFWPQEVDR